MRGGSAELMGFLCVRTFGPSRSQPGVPRGQANTSFTAWQRCDSTASLFGHAFLPSLAISRHQRRRLTIDIIKDGNTFHTRAFPSWHHSSHQRPRLIMYTSCFVLALEHTFSHIHCNEQVSPRGSIYIYMAEHTPYPHYLSRYITRTDGCGKNSYYIHQTETQLSDT